MFNWKFRFDFKSDSDFENLKCALFLEQVKRTEIRVPRGSTPVITEVVEISEVKRSDKNTALDLFVTFWGDAKK
jgi:hypothetical protein